MKQAVINIQLKNGLEARPVALLVQAASKFMSSVYLETKNHRVNAKSIMGMMSLNLIGDEEIKIVTQGEDEDIALEGMVEFFQQSV
ncbi:MAG: HPr family phosphocarrier protein [Clostridium sp.]|jgi:catabolite repression HPr-like protein|nr:HPr family phosphocarrier protein [Clostridium sp.]